MSIGPRRAEMRAHVDIHAPVLAVWDLVTSPGSDGLDLEPGEIAYRAPGTGPGVGEIHVHVRRRPDERVRLTVEQITVFDVGVKASTSLLGENVNRLTLDYTLDRAEGGAVRLTAVVTIEISDGRDDVVVDRALSAMTRGMAERYETRLRRYKEHLETAAAAAEPVRCRDPG